MIKIHAFRVIPEDGSQPVQDVLDMVAQANIEERLRLIGSSEIRVDDIFRDDAGYYLFDTVKFDYGVGPGRGDRLQPVTGFRLGPNESFAHEGACLYAPESRYLLVEYKHSGARSGAICEYLSTFNDAATNIYSLQLKLDPAVARRLGRKQIVKRLRLKIAPNRLSRRDLERGQALEIGLRQGDAFGGQVIDLAISTEPYSRGSLNIQRVREAIEWVQRVAGGNEDAVLKASVEGKDDPEAKIDAIDILAQKLEQRFDGYQIGDDRRIRREDRYDALVRTFRAWSGIL